MRKNNGKNFTLETSHPEFTTPAYAAYSHREKKNLWCVHHWETSQVNWDSCSTGSKHARMNHSAAGLVYWSLQHAQAVFSVLPRHCHSSTKKSKKGRHFNCYSKPPPAELRLGFPSLQSTARLCWIGLKPLLQWVTQISLYPSYLGLTGIRKMRRSRSALEKTDELLPSPPKDNQTNFFSSCISLPVIPQI